MTERRLDRTEGRPGIGGGVNGIVEWRGLSGRLEIGGAAAAVLLDFLLWRSAPSSSSQTIEA